MRKIMACRWAGSSYKVDGKENCKVLLEMFSEEFGWLFSNHGIRGLNRIHRLVGDLRLLSP